MFISGPREYTKFLTKNFDFPISGKSFHARIFPSIFAFNVWNLKFEQNQ